MTAADQLRAYLKANKGWVAKNALCRLELKTKKGGLYGADLISRTLRAMEEERMVAVKYIDKHSHYRYIPDFVRHLYIPTSLRGLLPEKRWSNEETVKELLSYYRYGA